MISHPFIALAIQSVIAIATGNWWIGAAAGSAYFVGREYAQAEHRVIEHHYAGRRANMPFWGGMQPRAWTLKGVADFVLPTLAVIGAALIARRFNHH